MLELPIITNRMNEILEESQSYLGRKLSTDDERYLKALRREYNEYVPIRDYLMSEPSEEFVNKEIARVENRLRLIDEDFVNWKPDKVFRDATHRRSSYDDMHDVPKLKKELKFYKRIMKII